MLSNSRKTFSFFIVLVLAGSSLYYLNNFKGIEPDHLLEEVLIEQDSLVDIPVEPKLLYGIAVDSLDVIEDFVKPNQSLSQILGNFNVPFETIQRLVQNSKDVFDVRKINARRKFTLMKSRDSLQTASVFIYEPNSLEYIVFWLKDSVNVYKQERAVTIKEKTMAGVITSSLYEDMLRLDGSAELVDMFADMFGWQLDFTKIFPGDKFKVIYEVKEVDGQEIGIHKVLAANFEHYNNDFYGFYFDQGQGTDYFDEDGKSLRKAFLRYPVKFTRISSRYSMNRYHPVQKRNKPHLGTDYAAPVGTPIHAAGDGIVTKATYDRGNGNYVKIKHNGIYETQYLHMSRIAGGMKVGRKVKQGEVIGFVGSTGLASGPHLCYRFWKNGKQVDALRVELPASEPIFEDQLHAYMMWASEMRVRLKEIPLPLQEQPLLAEAL